MSMRGKRLLLTGGMSFIQDILDFSRENGIVLITTGNIKDTVLKRYADEQYDVDTSDVDAMTELVKKAHIDGIFAGGLGFDMVVQGAIIAVLTLFSYFAGHYMAEGTWSVAQSPAGMTTAFLTLSMTEIFHAFNMRSRRQSLFAQKKQNKWPLH